MAGKPSLAGAAPGAIRGLHYHDREHVLMALFFFYQKWRYDSTTAQIQEQDRRWETEV